MTKQNDHEMLKEILKTVTNISEDLKLLKDDIKVIKDVIKDDVKLIKDDVKLLKNGVKEFNNLAEASSVAFEQLYKINRRSPTAK